MISVPMAEPSAALSSRDGLLVPFLGRDRRNGACLHKLHRNEALPEPPLHFKRSTHSSRPWFFNVSTFTNKRQKTMHVFHSQSSKSGVSCNLTCKFNMIMHSGVGRRCFMCALYACGHQCCGLHTSTRAVPLCIQFQLSRDNVCLIDPNPGCTLLYEIINRF